MSSTPEIPDAASTEQLLQRIRKLRSDGGLPPRNTTLPALPLSRDNAGMLDLTVVVEQLVLDAGGAGILQMLHLASFVLDAVIDGVKQELTPYIKERGEEQSPVDEAIGAGVVARAGADIILLSASQNLLHYVLTPLTGKFGADRTKEEASLGHDGMALLRHVLVSDALIEALGIERSDFDAYFKKRFSRDLG